MISAGKTNKITNVAELRPKQIVIAIDTTDITKLKVSKIKGVSSAMFIKELRMTALNRNRDAPCIAYNNDSPASRFLRKKLISTISSLTTIPKAIT